MDLSFISQLLSPIWAPIAGVLGVLIGAFFLTRKAKQEQKQKDLIATQKETINAHKTRNTVEDVVRNADPDERERLRDKWRRD